MITSIDNIREACLEIAYDNGMIGRIAPSRFSTEEDVLREMLERVEQSFSLADIHLVEAELNCLDEHMFQQAIEGNGISYLANDLLNVAFEGVE